LASGVVAQAAGPAANLPTRTIEPSHELTLSEEEVFDVSLATFYVFDRENTPGFQLVRGGCGGCGHGCGGCGHGCGGCHAMGGAVASTQWVATAAVASAAAAVADALEAATAAAVADALEAAADVASSGGVAAAAVYRGARASSARPHRFVQQISDGGFRVPVSPLSVTPAV